jgi:hypothetical protein
VVSTKYEDLIQSQLINAQGSRVIIVVVHVGAVKIYMYLVPVEALKKKERQDETQFITKIDGKTSLGPSYFTYVSFSEFMQ